MVGRIFTKKGSFQREIRSASKVTEGNTFNWGQRISRIIRLKSLSDRLVSFPPGNSVANIRSRYVQKTLTDTDFIDEDIADSEREMDLLTEMIRQTVMQNASATVTEDEYRCRYNDLTDRFRTEEEKHKRLTERRKRMVAESIAIGGMLSELIELEAPPIEFDEKLWHAVVDRVTVYTITAWFIH